MLVTVDTSPPAPTADTRPSPPRSNPGGARAAEPGGAVPTDAELAARVGTDKEAFAELYRRNFAPVYWFCLGRLRDVPAAEDAAAQVFANAFAALPRYRDREGGFRSWLFRIAHNAVVDSVRARSPHAPLEAAAEVADPAPTPEALAVAGEGRRVLWAALGQLPASQRRVVELRLAGLTGAEIAAALGRPRGWVDTNQCRAVIRLRAILGVVPSSEEARHARG